MTGKLESRFLPLCAAWAVLMLLAVRLGADRDRRTVSLGFFLGALAAVYALAAASYQPDRCLCTAGLFLIIACLLLIPELLSTRAGDACMGLLCVLAVLFALRFVTGNLDILRCGYDARLREQRAAAQIAAGETVIVLDRIHAETPYSPAYGLKDLDLADPGSWPNWTMARYYGVERIIGQAAPGN